MSDMTMKDVADRQAERTDSMQDRKVPRDAPVKEVSPFVDVPRHTFGWAIVHMLQGHKVRRKAWILEPNPTLFVYWSTTKNFFVGVSKEASWQIEAFDEVSQTDWELHCCMPGQERSDQPSEIEERKAAGTSGQVNQDMNAEFARIDEFMGRLQEVRSRFDPTKERHPERDDSFHWTKDPSVLILQNVTKIANALEAEIRTLEDILVDQIGTRLDEHPETKHILNPQLREGTYAWEATDWCLAPEPDPAIGSWDWAMTQAFEHGKAVKRASWEEDDFVTRTSAKVSAYPGSLLVRRTGFPKYLTLDDNNAADWEVVSVAEVVPAEELNEVLVSTIGLDLAKGPGFTTVQVAEGTYPWAIAMALAGSPMCRPVWGDGEHIRAKHPSKFETQILRYGRADASDVPATFNPLPVDVAATDWRTFREPAVVSFEEMLERFPEARYETRKLPNGTCIFAIEDRTSLDFGRVDFHEFRVDGNTVESVEG